MKRGHGLSYEKILEGFLLCEASTKLERFHKGMEIWVVKLSRLFVSRPRKQDITILLKEIMWVYHRFLISIYVLNVLKNRDGSKYSDLDEEKSRHAQYCHERKGDSSDMRLPHISCWDLGQLLRHWGEQTGLSKAVSFILTFVKTISRH